MLAALAGCSKAVPEGQVIAIVEGTEVTLAELNEEGRSRGLDIAGDRALRDALLQELVDRKLLVREAERRQLDRSPDFLLAERRMREILLGQQLLATATHERGSMSDADLRRFVAANPLAFERREVVRVHAVALPAALPPPLRQALSQAPDRAAMEKILAAARIPSRWTQEDWDSAAPPMGLAGWPTANAFLLERAGGMVAGQVMARQPQPVPAEQQLVLARTLVQRQRAELALASIVGESRGSADIRYQPGYAPAR